MINNVDSSYLVVLLKEGIIGRSTADTVVRFGIASPALVEVDEEKNGR